RPTACCGDAKRPALHGSLGFRDLHIVDNLPLWRKECILGGQSDVLFPSFRWRFVVIHNCCVLCRLSGCLDKIVVSVGRRSPPLTTTEGRDLPRGSAKGVGSDEHGRGHKPALRRRRRGSPGWPGGHGSRSVPRLSSPAPAGGA